MCKTITCTLAMLAACGSGKTDKADKADKAERKHARAELDDESPRKRDRDDDDEAPRKRDRKPDRRDDDEDDRPRKIDRDDATCRRADDCPNIVCRCEDGSSINARQCNNGTCEAELETCTSVCDKHDGRKGTWNDADGKKTGARCRAGDECASTLCTEGYCTRSCSSFGDCPPFWDCDDNRCVKR